MFKATPSRAAFVLIALGLSFTTLFLSTETPVVRAGTGTGYDPSASVAVFLLATGPVLASNATCLATAENEPSGKITGAVLDANDARIVNASIMIENGVTRRRVKSGDEGEFEITLPPGDYRITVEADGFRQFSYSPFTVLADETTRIKVHLKVAIPPGLVPAERQSVFQPR